MRGLLTKLKCDNYVHLVAASSIRKVWNNHNNYRDHAHSLGKLMLLARRLCERGCGFVTVTTNFVWDMHADQNNATMTEGMGYVGAPFDHAISAFIQDVHERGLQEKILLVCCGEMGRTPKINAKGGRDHWGRLAPLMLSGGGLNMGQVIGQSTRDAGAWCCRSTCAQRLPRIPSAACLPWSSPAASRRGRSSKARQWCLPRAVIAAPRVRPR